MKRRSRILAALTAGVMAAGAMCFGFAQWSTSLALQGTVSASGKWDVGISKAEVTSFSTGAAVTPTRLQWRLPEMPWCIR